MADLHKIDRLTIRIDQATNLPNRTKLEKKIQAILEEYFDQYSIPGLDTFFESIELDLGELEIPNFEQELEVRLRFVLREELSKFFGQQGIEKQIITKAESISSEQFGEYVQYGYNTRSDETLTDVFAKLRSIDSSSIRESIDDTVSWKIIRKRLLEQIDFVEHETHWMRNRSAIYTQIRDINQKIIQDFAARPMTDFGFAGLQGLLKKFTFDFMFDHSSRSISRDAYIVTLRRKIKEFAAFSDGLSTPVREYFQLLAAAKSGDAERKSDAFLSVSSRLSRSDDKALITYLVDGRSPKKLSVEQLQNYARHLSLDSLEVLTAQLGDGLTGTKFIGFATRLHRLFSPIQLRSIYRSFKTVFKGRVRQSAIEISKLSQIVEIEFGENLFHLDGKIFGSHFIYRETKKSFSPKLLIELARYLSARKSLSQQGAMSRLGSRLLSEKKYSIKSMNQALVEAIEAIREEGAKSPKSADSLSWSSLRLVIHFLESGIWIGSTSSPQEAMAEILDSEAPGFRLALADRINNPVVWMRLIHQFDLAQVHSIFRSVFGLHDQYPHLMEAIRFAKESGKSELERELLEAFVQTQIRLQSDEEWSHLGNFHLEFALILGPEFKPNQPVDSAIGHDVETVLFDWISAPNELPSSEERNRVLASAAAQIASLQRMMVDANIPEKTWQLIFKDIENEVIVDLIDRLHEVVNIDELESLVQILHEPSISQNINQVKLVSMLYAAAQGLSSSLVSQFKSEWKRLKKEKSTAISEIETRVLKNSAQKAWIGQKEDSELLQNFLFELGLTIQKGQFRPSESYDSFGSFERSLRRYFELHEPALFRFFEESATSEVLALLHRLSHTTLSAIKLALDNKFRHRAYLDVVFTIRTHNTEARQEVDRFILAYGLKSSQFDQHVFFQFLSENHPALELPVSTSLSIDRSLAQFHRILRNLKNLGPQTSADQKTITEDDLLGILKYQRDLLVEEIRFDPDLKRIIKNLLEVFPVSKWTYPISRLLQLSQETVQHDLLRFQDETNKAVDIVVHQLLRCSRKGIKVDSELIFSVPKLTAKERETIGQIAAEEGVDQEETLTLIPAKILLLGIHTSYAKEYDVFQLVNSVAKNAAIPSWSCIQSSQETYDLLKFMQGLDLSPWIEFIEDLVKHPRHVHGFHSILGSQRFLDFMEWIYPKEVNELISTLDLLIEVHESFGPKKALRSYFLKAILFSQWPINAARLESSARKVMARIPIDFGITKRDYSELLALKSLSQSNKAMSSLITSFTDGRIADQIRSGDYRLRRNIDLLTHLILENEIPWWADHSKTSRAKLSQHIEEFSIRLLNNDPENWVAEIAKTGSAIDVYQHLVRFMSNQQFDRMILALAPSLGGFVVSLNILVNRSAIVSNETEWRLFVVEYSLKTKELTAVDFVSNALTALKRLKVPSISNIQEELQKYAAEAVSSGESRFRPLLEILSSSSPRSKSELTMLSEAWEVVGFDDVVKHYLRFGSHPVDTFPKARTYYAFIQDLELKFSMDNGHIRSLIAEELKDRRVRSRIVRFESDHFIFFLIHLLFPSTKRGFAEDVKMLQHFMIDLIGLENSTVIHDFIYATIFEQALSANPTANKSDDLLIMILKRSNQQFDLTEIEKEVLIEIYNFSEQVSKFVVSNLFAADSKLKLSIEEESDHMDDSLLTLDEWKKSQVEPEVGKLAEDISDGESVKESDPEEDHDIHGVMDDDQLDSDVDFEDVPEVALDFEVNIKNAGLVIVWPYLARYFEILGMLKDKKFKSKKASYRAVQLLQFLATGLETAPEHELLLNKVLCGVKIATPIPFEIDLTDEERDVSDQMLKGLLQNWPRVQTSSVEALREGFLLRDARLLELEESWQLKVEGKTLDILMDGMPWSFGIIKLPWMDKRLIVEWT